MKPTGIATPTPRPAPRAYGAYGLDIGGAAPAPRPTFPTRVQPSAVPAAPVETPASQPKDDAAALRPPKGTDPELWKILTADERAFFAREEAMGPLSYGQRISAGPTMPSRGGRLSIRG